MDNKLKNSISKFTLFVAIIAAIGGLLFGYNSSVISGVMLFLSDQMHLTTAEEGIIVAILLIGALLGAMFGGMFSDKVGRKWALLLCAILNGIGTLILVMSDMWESLLIGRFVTGFGIGIASVVVPLYIAEMSPAKSRGLLVSFNQLAITFGILLASTVDWIYANDAQWRWMFGFSLLPTLAMIVAVFFIAETPSFLASKGKLSKAKSVMKKIDPLHSQVVLEGHEKKEIQQIGSWKHLLEKSLKPALVVGIGISVLQQFTGINLVIYYAPKIFQLAGFADKSTAIFANFTVGIINLIMTIIALWLIDRVGRKPLLFVGIIGMAASLLALSLGFKFSGEFTGYVSVISVMTYIGFFAISLGPVAWLIISEIYPLGIRGRAMGVATLSNWLSNFVVSFSFLPLVKLLSPSGTFFLYSLICVVALWFVCKKVPETKGKTFEEIQAFWVKKN